jgi:hypothetical protein
MFHGVGRSLMHVGKLPEEQRVDVISAALNAFKVTIVDEIAHGALLGEVSDSELRARIADLAHSTEQARQQTLDRFVNLCELIPDAKIKVEVVNVTDKEVAHAVH